MRIVLDTNLWVAALLGASMRERIRRIIADERFEILADAELLDELEEVCTRPKFSHLLSAIQIADYLKILSGRFTIVEPTSKIQVCRDPDDDYLLAICFDGEAEFLLTGYKDLLSLHTFERTRILTIPEFEEL